MSSITGVVTLNNSITGLINRTSDYEHYSGSYTVTPLAYNQVVLNTQSKVLDSNITVEEIPYTETSNPSGGYTVNIGGS